MSGKPSEMTDKPISILFVCLGNICRSPLAEAAFRQEAERAGLAVEVDSAGTGDWHAGDAPDARAQATALRHGVDISGYRARQVTIEDFQRFDHIFAMDRANLAALRGLGGGGTRPALLLDLIDGREGDEVADPYYGGPDGFETTWADVSAAARCLVDRLTR